MDIKKLSQIIHVNNILKEDFTFRYDNVEFVVPAAGVDWPRPIAEHAAFKMVDRAIMKYNSYEIDTPRGPQKIIGGQPLADSRLREKYTKEILGDLDGEEAKTERPLTEGEKLKLQIEKMSRGESIAEEEGFKNLDEHAFESEERLQRRSEIEETMTWKEIQELAKQYEVMKAGMSKAEAIEAILEVEGV